MEAPFYITRDGMLDSGPFALFDEACDFRNDCAAVDEANFKVVPESMLA